MNATITIYWLLYRACTILSIFFSKTNRFSPDHVKRLPPWCSIHSHLRRNHGFLVLFLYNKNRCVSHFRLHQLFAAPNHANSHLEKSTFRYTAFSLKPFAADDLNHSSTLYSFDAVPSIIKERCAILSQPFVAHWLSDFFVWPFHCPRSISLFWLILTAAITTSSDDLPRYHKPVAGEGSRTSGASCVL